MLSYEETVFKEALLRAGLEDCLTRYDSSGWLDCLEAEIYPMKPPSKFELELLKRVGALWGDIAYELDEARQDAPSCDKHDPCDKHGMSLLVALGPIHVQVVIKQPAVEMHERLPKRQPAQELPFDFVKCFNCPFAAHTNPPAHFTEEDVGFCCSRCRMDGRHGGQCQKRLV